MKTAIIAIALALMATMSASAQQTKPAKKQPQTKAKSETQCMDEVRTRYGRTLGPNAAWGEMVRKCQRGEPY